MLTGQASTLQPDDNPRKPDSARIFADGEMAERIRRHPWETTAIGAISGWCEALLYAVNMMLESQFPMLLIWGPEMVVLYNDACMPLEGERHPDALGRTGEACWPEAWHILAPKLRAVLAQGAKLYFENELIPILHQGSLTDFYWTYSYSPVRDAAGAVRGILAVSHDVTARLKAERERDAVAANLKNVLESTTDGLAVLDRQGRYSYVNDQAARIVAMRPAEMIGRTQWELFPHAEESEYGRQYREAVKTGIPRHFDNFYPEPLHAWFECHCYPSEHGVSIYFRDVTEKKETERALRVSESRFRKLFESDMMGVAIPDRFGAFRESNDALLRMTGYTREDQEAGLVRWDTMTPPEYADIDRAHIREAAQRGSCTPYEKEYIRKDGGRVPILCGYALLEGSEDEYVGFVLDLSEQKRAEQQAERELREREERFHALAESVPQLIWIANSKGETTYCNQRVFEYFGLVASETDIPLWRERFHPEDVDNTFGAWRRSIARSEPYQVEYRLRRHDGVYRYFLARAVPVRNEGGDVERWIGSCTDIHDWKLAERGLREREERFRILADSLPQLIWMTDGMGENTYCNQRYLDYLGVTEAERANIPWLELIHPDDFGLTLKIWNDSVQSGEPYLNEFRLRRKDGMFRYFLARAVPFRNDGGQIERWIGSLTDTHEQKLAEEALRKSEKLATAGRLAASIAHEINNPLAGVTNCLYLALQDDSLKRDTKNYLQTAEEELRRVAHITTQTLRFHKQSNSPTATDLCEIVDSVLALFGQRLAGKNIRVSAECERGAVAVCLGDEMRQVIANIVSNAMDAMPHGGSLRVRVKRTRSWAKEGCDGVKIVVADSGHGIPPAVMGRLFEPFVSTKEATGIGLGLWVSHGIVRKHAGAIRVRSRVKARASGTVFGVFIPSTCMIR
jgi:PAS domain S-box-containing protein